MFGYATITFACATVYIIVVVILWLRPRDGDHNNTIVEPQQNMVDVPKKAETVTDISVCILIETKVENDQQSLQKKRRRRQRRKKSSHSNPADTKTPTSKTTTLSVIMAPKASKTTKQQSAPAPMSAPVSVPIQQQQQKEEEVVVKAQPIDVVASSHAQQETAAPQQHVVGHVQPLGSIELAAEEEFNLSYTKPKAVVEVAEQVVTFTKETNIQHIDSCFVSEHMHKESATNHQVELPDKWCFYAHMPCPEGGNYNESAKCINKLLEFGDYFDDIETFWTIFNIHEVSMPTGMLRKPQEGDDPNRQYAQHTELSLFKHGIMPATEDPANKDGSKILVRMPEQGCTNILDGLWLDCALLAVSGQMPNHEHVNGVRLLLRPPNVRFEIWLNTSDEAIHQELDKWVMENIFGKVDKQLAGFAHYVARQNENKFASAKPTTTTGQQQHQPKYQSPYQKQHWQPKSTTGGYKKNKGLLENPQ